MHVDTNFMKQLNHTRLAPAMPNKQEINKPDISPPLKMDAVKLVSLVRVHS